MTLNGQQVVVMGGSSGIGEATAALFAAEGAEVVITGRDQQRLDRAVERIDGKVTAHTVDATDPGQVTSFFAETPEIDHLVLTVSSSSGAGPFATLDFADLQAGFEGKFWPYVRILQTALPKMRADGSVVFVTAASARAALVGSAGLAAINGALEAMVPPLAVELGPLRVNAVSPGVVDTPWWDNVPTEIREELFRSATETLPVGRVGRPEDIARAILLLSTNRYITGTVLEAAGGVHLATGR
jgi:NAD(P)-dependent dehydrogenase (short-subunit alcohol dehydrogenase family)